MRKSSKKGQVTIFIIIGLLLLIGVALYFYLTTRAATPKIDLPRLEGDAGQVQSFVESCINQVGRTGIIELGRHGGYIDPLNSTYTSINLQYNIAQQTESDMAFLSKTDETTGLPYWYYAKSKGVCWHCDISSLSPPVQFMEFQLGAYIDNNLKECLDNFSSFKEQGFEIVSVTNITTQASILQSSVAFLSKYTIQITRNDETKYIEAFYTEIDIPLLQYYNIAVNITQNEVNNDYLDLYALYLLGQYSGVDSTKLPPLGAYRTGYDPVFWSKTNVRRTYESLLSSYTQFFRIVGTSNDATLTSNLPIESKMYGLMRLPMFSEQDINALDLKNKEINHIYIGQPMYLDVRPSNGELVSPLVSKDNSQYGKALEGSVEPDQDYNFYYDISYPVIIEIKDTRPDKEYIFMFALQGNIKENTLLSDWLAGLGTIPWSEDYAQIYDSIPAGTQTLDIATGENVSHEPLTTTTKFFCDKEQRLSGDILLRTYDSVTSKPLNGVTLTYYCGTYASCYVDVTRYNATLDEASFNAKLPLCMNGIVKLEKNGYLPKNIPLTTEYQKSDYLGSMYLEPIVTKNSTVKKYNLTRVENSYSLNTVMDLSDNDSVIISLNKITFNQFDEPWSQTILFGKEGLKDSDIKLVPGVYTLNAQLLDYTGVIIPKECQKICVKKVLGICKEYISIPSDDIKMGVAMQGGIEFNDTNPFIVTVGDLLSNNSLEFYVARMPNPRCLDDMNEPTKTGMLAKKYRTELTPQFK